MSKSPKVAVTSAQSGVDPLAELVLRFDQNWLPGQIDAVAAELQSWPPEQRSRAFVTLVKIDLERRWQSGHATEIEQYLARFPELGTADTVAPELLMTEWEVRKQFGKPPRFGDFARRFPKQASALQSLIKQAAARDSTPRLEPPSPLPAGERGGVSPPVVLEPRPPRDTSKVMSHQAISQVSPELGERGGVSPPVSQPTHRGADAAPLADLPERFGRYRIVRRLAAGGMGAVYLAEDTQLERQVALKVPHFDTQTSSDVLERFEREARTAAKLSHPNICQVFDVGVIDGRHFLTMEYIDGRPLTKWVGSQKLTDRQIVTLIRKIAIAVGEAHQRGIIHRDLKPANVMITAKGEPKVMDFGLAKRTGADEARLTSSGMIIGTPAYMPLEQLQGALDEIGPHSDVYSLGVIFYELLTGHLPFEVPSDAPVTALFAKILTAPPDSPTKHRPDLDTSLEAIVLKAIAKQHTDRYHTMAEFADALDGFRRAGGVSLPVTPNDALAPDIAGLAPTGGLTPPARQDTARGDNLAFPLFTDWDTDSAPVPIGQRQKKSTFLTTTVLVVVCLCIGFGCFLGVTNWFRSGDALVKIEVHSDDQEIGRHRLPPKPVPAPPSAIAPFEAAVATQHQTEWAAYLKVPVVYTNNFDMEFVLIPPGEFMMGSTPEEIEAELGGGGGGEENWKRHIRSEAPQHKVKLTQPIYLGVHEVTQAQYEMVMGNNPSHFAPMGKGKVVVARIDTKRHPVETVCWYDAVEFCTKLSEKEKLKPVKFEPRAGEAETIGRTGYRLPTEAEWEYACRAGTTKKYGIIDEPDDLTQTGWFRVNEGLRTHVVGELTANQFGLYDVHGNVWEWVQDWWARDYYEQFHDRPAVDPKGPSSSVSERVLRGGAWDDIASDCRASNRGARDPTVRSNYIGFRVSLVVDDALKAVIAER